MYNMSYIIIIIINYNTNLLPCPKSLGDVRIVKPKINQMILQLKGRHKKTLLLVIYQSVYGGGEPPGCNQNRCFF